MLGTFLGVSLSFKAIVKALLPSPVRSLAHTAVTAVKRRRPPEKVFRNIYRENGWGDSHSASGPGSNLEATKWIRAALPKLIAEREIRSLLDIPCGDMHWMKETLPPGVEYIGADIVPDIIISNRAKYAHLGRFEILDLVKSDLPEMDLVLIRDCLIHLPLQVGVRALANVSASGSRYILTSSYPGVRSNDDIDMGGYRPINLLLPPFSLPEPITFIPETEDSSVHFGKGMGLWLISDLRELVKSGPRPTREDDAVAN